MKASKVAYVRAETLDDVFDLLDEAGERARILAGGQSLVAALNLRLDEDVALIDINRVQELSGIADRDETLRIGALTRPVELGASTLIAEHAPLLLQAVPLIAHAAIRSRGTIGGSLANADPAAELAACVVALDAEIVATSRAGERRIPASRFFTGLFDTALRPGELLSAIIVRKAESGERQQILELTRRSGDFAIVGLAGVRRAHSTRLAYFGVGDTPVLAANTMKALGVGATLDAAVAALSNDLDPPSDANVSARYRMHLAAVLLRRMVGELSSGSRMGMAA